MLATLYNSFMQLYYRNAMTLTQCWSSLSHYIIYWFCVCVSQGTEPGWASADVLDRHLWLSTAGYTGACDEGGGTAGPGLWWMYVFISIWLVIISKTTQMFDWLYGSLCSIWPICNNQLWRGEGAFTCTQGHTESWVWRKGALLQEETQRSDTHSGNRQKLSLIFCVPKWIYYILCTEINILYFMYQNKYTIFYVPK